MPSKQNEEEKEMLENNEDVSFWVIQYGFSFLKRGFPTSSGLELRETTM